MLRIRGHLALATVGVACVAPIQAAAQATEPVHRGEPNPITVLPEVKVKEPQGPEFRKESTSTATRTETPLRDIPQFIDVVPEALIRSQNASSLQEALRNVPGLTYAAGEGGSQANQLFYLRGFPAGGDLFLDGVRDLGEYNRDLFATETVEVLKGPSALMFGRGSTAGIINQGSKLPGVSPRREVGLTLGSHGTKRLTADWNERLGEDHAVRLAALAEDSGAYRYPQDVKRVGFAPSVRFGIGNPVDITLAYYFLKTEDVTDYGQPSLTPAYTGSGQFAMPQVSPEKYYGYARHDYADHTTNIATAKVEWRITGDLRLRNVTRVARYERSVEATIATLAATDVNGRPVTPATPLELLRVTRNHDSGRTRDNDDDAIVNQTDLTWTPRPGHQVLAGLEIARERLDRVGYTLDADPNQPGTQAPTSFTSFLDPDPSTLLSYTKTPNLRALAEGKTVAAYLQDQFDIGSGWSALLGARYDRYTAEARTESALSGTIAVTTGPFERTEGMWSGRGGLIFQPDPALTFYVAASNSYNPSGELGVYGQNGTNLNPVNVDLAPERNVGYELGGTWDSFGHDLQLRAAIFRNQKSNARKLEEDGTTVLTGKRRVDGIEFQLAGHLTPHVHLYSGIAFMDGEIVSAPGAIQGNVPLGVPRFAGNVWAIYSLGDGWEVGGGVRGTSGFWLDDANTGKVPAAAIVDLTAAYFKDRLEVRLNVVNATGRTHYIGGYENTPNRVIPGEPRSYSVTLRYAF